MLFAKAFLSQGLSPSLALIGAFADKAEPLIDADMRLVADHGRGDLRQRRPLLEIADLAADLQRPARIGILLVSLVRLAPPDLLGRFARFDSGLFFLSIVRCLGAGTSVASTI